MKNELPKSELVDMSVIKEKIYIIRGKKVMLDRDLAMLYGVPTMRLNQAVKRNINRFPSDFMFELTKDELSNWISQIVISNSSLKQGLRKPPLAFTEQGVAMLSSVLNSDRAIAVNIQIIRIFTKLREMIDQYKELRQKIEEIDANNRINFTAIFKLIDRLIKEDEKPKGKIGF